MEEVQQDRNLRRRQLELAEEKLQQMEDLKNAFGNQLAARLAKIQNDGEFWKGQCESAFKETSQSNEET